MRIPAVTSTFDTLQIAKRLKSGGFGDDQAEAITIVLRETRDADLSRLVTKEDLLATKNELKSDLTTGINSLRAEMGIMRRDIAIRLGGMLVVATGVLLAAKSFG
jgi:hypothetical protein